jgi:hypothetical protein
MMRSVFWLPATAYLFVLLVCGCSIGDIRDRTGPAYDLAVDKIGTGLQAITPSNDIYFCDGMPMDARTKK